jgi:putative lipoprotein
MRVDGVVLIPTDMPPFRSATIHVRLLDVSLADGPSTVVAEQTLTDVSRPARRNQAVPFTLEADLPDDWKGSLIVASHVDLVGDGVVHSGDGLTTASHPVPTQGGSGMVVAVKPIT